MTACATQREHVVIRASAGTGKTFQLSNRFLSILAGGEAPERLLATTFARKAAGEIMERVLLRLADAALDADRSRELAGHLQMPKLEPAAFGHLLGNLIQRLHRLRVGTLDSFFMQLATSFSLELGLPPGWKILEPLDDVRLRSEAIRRVLEQAPATGSARLMHLLSKGEAARSITDQIVEMVDGLYDIYCETQPEAWQRLGRLTPLESADLAAAIESLASLSDLPNKHFINAHTGDLANAREGNWDQFVCKGLGGALAAGKETFQRREIDPPIAAAYEPLVKHARAVLVNQLANQTEGTHKLLADFDAAYRQIKFRERGYRFEDITRVLAAAMEQGGLANVFYRLDGQIGHLLLDEFQDTSLAQWQVIERFARSCTEPDSGKSFFCVGDGKQAIYGWRGGIAEIFDCVEQRLPGLVSQSLVQSFRSSPVVIDVVNRLFEHLDENCVLADFPTARKAWLTGYQQHTTAKSELPGYACLQVAPAAADGEKQAEATLRFAAGEIARLAALHPGRSIGVLVRRNSAVARLIYELRTHHEVLASEEGGNPLTDSAAVQVVLSLVRLADHPGDTAARFHVAGSPLGRHVGLMSHDDDAAACGLSRGLRRQLLERGYGPTIYGWLKHLAASCDQRELNRLLQLVEVAYGYDERATLRADDFVDYVLRRKVEDPTAAEVRVMTVHQAKGLEFDLVVLPELDVQLKGQPPRVVVGRSSATGPIETVCRYAGKSVQPLLPAELSQLFDEWPERLVAESLCLLYVAMTRAVHALHMIISPAKENERSCPKTFAGALREGLAAGRPVMPGSILLESGNASWAAEMPREAATAAPAGAASELLEVRLRPTAKPRELQRRSPSSLEGGGQVDLGHLLRRPAKVFERGELMHRWLQAVEWLDDGRPDEWQLRELAASLHWAAGPLTDALADFYRLLDRPFTRAALSRAAYDRAGRMRLKVERERPFALRQGDVLMSGAIDRLVLIYDKQNLVAAEILDFKTDKVAGAGEVVQKIEFYRPQIEAYRSAVMQLTGLERSRVSARLLFVEADGCHLVEDSRSSGG
ncbi:MAG TPA: UvrD-helicase domain-containing protein [Pirellulales bacterium]|jgi:ATP-dependent exoDNAse (exonuclease V) beta subunit|nr:UvrD-helicase domain-containing protein [Pirellulales bacterium]